MNFCSLDEAWGSCMDEQLPETNNKTYSNFEMQVKNNNQQIENKNQIQQHLATQQHNNIGKQIIMNNQNDRNIVSNGNPNQLMDRKHLGLNNIDKILENIERRIKNLENRNNNNVLNSLFSSDKSEYIILIIVAVVGIYFLDKYLNGTAGKLL